MKGTHAGDNNSVATDRGLVQISRRGVLTGLGGSAIGAGAFSLLPENGNATVLAASVNSLDVGSEHAELKGEPSSVPVTISGEWTLDTTVESVEQVKTVLGIQVNGATEEPDVSVTFSPDSQASGEFTLEADLLDHSELSASDFNPGNGETFEQQVKFLVTVQVIADGAIAHEETALDETTVGATQVGDSTTLGIEAGGTVDVTQ